MDTSWVHRTLCALRVPAVARAASRGLILCYHNVVAEDPATPDPTGLHCPLTRFQDQMEWLARRYRCLSLGEFVHRVAAGRSLRGVAAVTFDDAYDGVFRHAVPVLRDLGVPATVFVVGGAGAAPGPFWWDRVGADAVDPRRTQWLEELRGDGEAIAAATSAPTSVATTIDIDATRLPADWNTIRHAAGSSLALGAHSLTHRSLTRLTDEELRTEVSEAHDIITSRTGVTPEFFSYPYGHWDRRVRSVVQTAGFRAAVTLDYGLNRPGADPWALKRVNVPSGISLAALETWAAGLRPAHLR